jgi:hypothetical protein
MFIFNPAVMSSSDLDERVEQLKRGFVTPVQTAELSFEQRLKQAVKQRVSNRGLPAGFMASASASDDEKSFRSKLADAARRIAGGKSPRQAREQAEMDGKRYRGLKRRPRTKSD